jgi:integrase
MAKIIRRVWRSRGALGERVKHVAYGYTLMVNRKQERKVSSAWLTETEALEALAKRQREIGAGQIERAVERTLGEVAEEYLAYKADKKKRSLADDTRIVRTRLLPTFGAGLPIRRLTAAAVAQYEKARLAMTTVRGGRKLSAYTVANELGVLRHLLRLARRWGYVETVPEIVLPKRPGGRLRYLSETEIARLLTACRASRNPYLSTIVVLALHTGMRRGEILALQWERIDLATARITLDETKNGTRRGVPINRAVYDALLVLEPDPARRTGRLFPPQRGAGKRGSQIRVAFEGALARAGITGFRFHDLRHTAASHLVMRGASLRDVQEVLGHTTLAMTTRYAHLSPAHLRGAVERLEGLTAAPERAASAHESAQSAPAADAGARNLAAT